MEIRLARQPQPTWAVPLPVDESLISQLQRGIQRQLELLWTDAPLTLTYASHAEGRLRRSADTLIFEYSLKDHLGNTRVMFTDSDGNGQPEALQEDNYYPFGLKMADGAMQPSQATVHLYNGKELQDELGLGWYDYGARMMNPRIGRWNGVDALGEERNWLSPFQYAQNNPIIIIDPDGNLDDIIIKGENNSSLTIETDLIDVEVDGSSVVGDLGGNYVVGGTNAVITGLDMVGVVDPTPVSDTLAGTLSLQQGDYWGALANGAGLLIPYAGDLAKIPKTAKGLDAIRGQMRPVNRVVGNGGGNSLPDFVVSPNGTSVPVSQGRMRQGFDNAGFPRRNVTQTSEPGVIHTVPGEGGLVDVRTMQGSGSHPQRAVFTRQGSGNDYTTVGGAKIRGNKSKSERRREGHLTQKP